MISGIVQRRFIKLHSSEDFNNLTSSLDLADTIPTENETSSVELLIGNDYYLDIILSQNIWPIFVGIEIRLDPHRTYSRN